MRGNYLWIVAAIATLAAGCSDDSSSAAGGSGGSAAAGGTGTGGAGGGGGSIAALSQAASETYAEIVYQSYVDTIELSEDMEAALNAFVASPSDANLQAAKDAWLAAREPYLETEVYRFYDGPIDNPTDGPEGALNAWPMDEAFVDYTRDAADAGIINNIAQAIDAETLRGENESGAEENISTGWHPIEFLLWGQDALDPSNNLPGQRPFTDYENGGTAANQARRGEYLDLLAVLLLEDLEFLRDAWAPGDDSNFRASFVGGDSEVALEQMLTGLIVLSGFETAGERLQVALDNGDQEDEHSCFSDNTHRDMAQDVQGIQNVWLGEYEALDSANSVSGTGVRDVVAALDADLAASITSQIEDALSQAQGLRPTLADPPFDVLISLGNTEGNAKVQGLIDSLRAVESLLSEAFTGL
ncbi:MAG: imelysin family protein, partial [Myxococcota bacterium]